MLALQDDTECFHTRAKIGDQNDHLSYRHSNDGILACVYTNQHHEGQFELRYSNDGPEVFSSDASLKSCSEIAV